MPRANVDSLLPGQRRALLVELIEAGHGVSQQRLVEALRERGIETTQATLSRDLRLLDAVKGPEGYRVSGDALDPYAQAVRQWLRSATAVQNQLVLRTPPGGASPLAVALDAKAPDGWLGTIAGDDTVLVIARSSRAARKLADTMNQYIEGDA